MLVPAPTRQLPFETVELCDLVLRRSDFQIRLLSKSPMLYKILARKLARGNPQAKPRVIFGLSAGTFDDDIARAIEPKSRSHNRRPQALQGLEQKRAMSQRRERRD